MSNTSMNNTTKLQLPQVTLAAISSVHLWETVQALKYSMKGIDFGRVVLFSHKKPFFLPKNIELVQIEKLSDINKYNHFCVFELGDYIETDFVLIVHHDGFVVNPGQFRDSFLDYDYIGSPWPLPKDELRFRDKEGNIQRVGNGVSLRSRRLARYPKEHNLPWEPNVFGNFYEDTYICCDHRIELEKDGIKFAPFEEAIYFGREHILPENENIEPFLFHQWRGINKKYPKFVNIPEKVYTKIRKMISG